MTINIKKLRDDAVIPTHGSEYAAGYDLYACCDRDMSWIRPGGVEMVSTGLALEIPEGYFGAIFARSGKATKEGLRPANCVEVIDSDYRGEVLVALRNDSDDHQNYRKGERIAQLVILPCQFIEFNEVQDVNDTDRGAGGFGSTGKSIAPQVEV